MGFHINVIQLTIFSQKNPSLFNVQTPCIEILLTCEDFIERVSVSMLSVSGWSVNELQKRKQNEKQYKNINALNRSVNEFINVSCSK